MEAITQNGRFCFAAEDSCRRIRLVMNMIGFLVLDITFTINTVDMVTLSSSFRYPARTENASKLV